MDKPVISNRFDLNDIRKIRDYNSSRHATMTREGIIADTREGAADLLSALLNRSTRKKITILSGGCKTVYEPPHSVNE